MPGNCARSVGASPSIRGLLRLRGFRLVLTIAALVLGSHALHDSFAMIRWKAAGDIALNCQLVVVGIGRC
jgi:PPP family 3-phenylpropionic acid transporter